METPITCRISTEKEQAEKAKALKEKGSQQRVLQNPDVKKGKPTQK